jgi:hypothetical protein
MYKFFAVRCLCIKRVQLRRPLLSPAGFCIVILLYLPLSKKLNRAFKEFGNKGV